MSGSMPSPIGELLHRFRVRAGLSQELLSEASGVSARTISDLERGQRASAHLETARLLADTLGLSDDERRQFLESARPVGGLSPASRRSPVGPERWAAALPVPATPLIGRARELDDLVALLSPRTDAIVTLTGPGGIGKTRLALKAAHRLADSFADGAVFVSLATVTQPDLVPDAIARALGMIPRANAAADQLTAALGSRELLLVLDNLEQVIEAAPFIAQLDAACAGLTILATSRMRLRVSRERTLAVPPLSLADSNAPIEQLRTSDAIQLFAERAREADPRFVLSDQNVAIVSEICRRLDGLPLAIELAASRLRILSAPALLERLDRRLPLLTGGDRDLPPRQQSMRATIAWSYELLDPAVKRFLQWMSLFTGGLSLESAEALGQALGINAYTSLETISALLDSALLRRTEPHDSAPRYSAFETIREFCFEQLAIEGELDAARRFHAEYFLEFASKDAPRPDELVREAWVGRLSPEHPNLITAFDELCTPETAVQGIRFAAALGPYWDYRGPRSEAQPRLSRALDFSPPEPSMLKLHALCWTAFVRASSPDYLGALEAAHQSVELANQIGSESDRAAAIQALATAHEYHEQFDTACELLEQAMDLWESVGNTVLHAVCLMLHAGIEYARGNLERAKHEAERTTLVFQELGEIGWTAGATWYQGMFAMVDGELAMAAMFYEQSLRTWLQSDGSKEWFKPLIGLADVGAATGRFVEASRLLGAADELLAVAGGELMPFDKPGYERAESRCREVLGDAAFETQALAGSQLSPDVWLVDAAKIVEAAKTSPTSSTD